MLLPFVNMKGDDLMGQMIDRDTYRNIKRMNRTELMDFLDRYSNHLLENEESIIDLSALRQELSKINGVGQKRLDEIMAVIEKFLDA